ncbi:MAG TPA: PLP-dependent aminotransferase family protein [Vicinamibacterales bacterium]|nr:PLP-dependent aminotransferase family protein [Vicinamibacterales bacterium]
MTLAAHDLALAFTPRHGIIPLYHQLCAALRDAILTGRLRPGSRLPSTRDVAARYRLSRGTVVLAFDQMKAEGYLTGRTGSGTFVVETLPDALLDAGRSQRSAVATRHRVRRLSAFANHARPFRGTVNARGRAFRANQPALDLFPTTLWAQVAGRRLRRSTTAMLRGCEPMGYPPLQRAVADYLGAARGVVCSPEQVAIVSGAQEAIDLATRLFVNQGDRVCMEDPGYPGASLAFAAAGADIVRVPLDAEGMKVPGARAGDVRLAYVTPAHQFPVGTCMSVSRRLALLQWARSTGATILEDDYDSEFRFSGAPVPALQSLDRHGTVLFTSSFSKVLFPSLRAGVLVVPADLIDRIAAIKSLTSHHAPLLDQAILCDFITEGHFGRHIRRMRGVYAERQTVLLNAVQDRLAEVLDISNVEAGLQTAAWFRRKIDGPAVVRAARRRDLDVLALSRFSSRPLRRDGLLLGFAAIDTSEIRRGVKELAVALAGVTRRGTRT